MTGSFISSRNEGIGPALLRAQLDSLN
jgi:hypothetical protein